MHCCHCPFTTAILALPLSLLRPLLLSVHWRLRVLPTAQVQPPLPLFLSLPVQTAISCESAILPLPLSLLRQLLLWLAVAVPVTVPVRPRLSAILPLSLLRPLLLWLAVPVPVTVTVRPRFSPRERDTALVTATATATLACCHCSCSTAIFAQERDTAPATATATATVGALETASVAYCNTAQVQPPLPLFLSLSL